jgi:hypothetical protein
VRGGSKFHSGARGVAVRDFVPSLILSASHCTPENRLDISPSASEDGARNTHSLTKRDISTYLTLGERFAESRYEADRYVRCLYTLRRNA